MFDLLFGPFFLIFFVAFFILVIVSVILIFARTALRATGQTERVPEHESTVREREIIREIVKIRCPYCGSLYEEAEDKCPHCGGRKQ